MTLVSGGKLLTGTLAGLQPSLVGIPPNATLEYIWNVTRSQNPPNISLGDTLGMRIKTTDQTPLGTYQLTLTYTGTGIDGAKYSQSRAIDFAVRPLPELPFRVPFPPDADLPAITQWEENMLTYGQKHMDRNSTGCCSDQSEVWYYDGARAFLQIAEYTGQEKFATFARRIMEEYRTYVLTSSGGPPWYARYPHGLEMFYERDGNQLSRTAIGVLQELASPEQRLQWGASWMNARDQAFSLSSHVIAERLGYQRSSLFQDHLALSLGHFEQWFISESAEYNYPFLVGLASEALIDYWELSHDVRVPHLLKRAADWLWENEWDPNTESFWLIEKQDGVIRRFPAPDLNLMVAPLYGWVFQQTGDVNYRTIGDKVFTSGVHRAWLDGGKQFTQNYRWSFKYIDWRKSPDSEPGTVAPVTGLSAVVDP